MNVYEAEVPQQAEGLKLEKYVELAFSLLPAHALRDAFAARDVKMDGKRVGKDTLAAPGAKIQLYTDYSMEIPIVYEDDNILLVNKPAGITCDADEWGGVTVLSLMEKRARGAYQPQLCHRLDNPTCGLLLLSKSEESQRLLLEDFKERRLTKKYQCLVRGEMRPREAVKTAFLVKDSEKAQVRIVTHETPGALPIATQYETLSFDGTVSRLLVTLLTGRTHQIRSQCAYHGFPLLGDTAYGGTKIDSKKFGQDFFLHAAELYFPKDNPIGLPEKLCAPVPEFFSTFH